MFAHEAVNDRLESAARLAFAFENQDGRLQERFARVEFHSATLHSEFDAERPAFVGEARFPVAGPTDREERAVRFVETRVDKGRKLARRPPARRRERLFFARFQREIQRREVFRNARRTAEQVERRGRLGGRERERIGEYAQILNDVGRLRRGEVRQRRRDFANREAVERSDANVEREFAVRRDVTRRRNVAVDFRFRRRDAGRVSAVERERSFRRVRRPSVSGRSDRAERQYPRE